MRVSCPMIINLYKSQSGYQAPVIDRGLLISPSQKIPSPANNLYCRRNHTTTTVSLAVKCTWSRLVLRYVEALHQRRPGLPLVSGPRRAHGGLASGAPPARRLVADGPCLTGRRSAALVGELSEARLPARPLIIVPHHHLISVRLTDRDARLKLTNHRRPRHGPGSTSARSAFSSKLRCCT